MPFDLDVNSVVEPFLFYESPELVEKAVATARKFPFHVLSKDSLTRHVFSVPVDEHCVAVQTAVAPTTLSDFPDLSFHSYSIRYRLCCQAIRALGFKPLIEETANAVHFASHRATFLCTECLEDNDPCRSSGTPKQNCSQVASVHLLGYITRQDDDRFSNDGNLQGQRLENRQHIHSHSFLNGQQYRSEPTAVPNNPSTSVVEIEGGFQQNVAGSLVADENGSNRRTGASEAILNGSGCNGNSNTPKTNNDRALISDKQSCDESGRVDHSPDEIGRAICKHLSKLEKHNGFAFTKASESSRLGPGEYAEKAMDWYDQCTSASKHLKSNAKTQIWQCQHLALCFLMSAQAFTADTLGIAAEKINRRIKEAEVRQGKKPTSSQWLFVLRNKTIMINQLVCSMMKIWGFPKALSLYCVFSDCHRKLGKVARQNTTKRSGFVGSLIYYLQHSQVKLLKPTESLFNPSDIVREALNIGVGSSEHVAVNEAIGFVNVSKKRAAPDISAPSPGRRPEDSGSRIIPYPNSWPQKCPEPTLPWSQTESASSQDLFSSLQPGYEWHQVSPESPHTETASSQDLFSSLQPGYQWRQMGSESTPSWPQIESVPHPDLFSSLEPGYQWLQTGLDSTLSWPEMDLGSYLNLPLSEPSISAN